MKIKEAFRTRYQSLPNEHKPIARLIAGVLCLILFILLTKGCHALASGRKTPPKPLMIRQGNEIIIPPYSELRTELKLHTVKKISKPHIVIFPGIVEADPTHTVNILPPLPGRLISLNVKLGDFVKPQQTLAEINSADLAQASADLAKAKAMLMLTEKTLQRANEVYRAGGNTIKEIQIAQNDKTQAMAQLNQTKSRLKTLGQREHFSSYKIAAPIEGRVIAINYGQGSYITDITVPILTISNLKTVWVTANVPESLAGVVEKNQQASIFLPAYPDQELHAKITFVNSFLEPDTRRNKTRIAFPNPNGKLQPNMFASVHVEVQQPNLIMIPISALLMNNDTVSVFVESSPWTFVRREIQLGLEDGENVRVLAGLTEGERVATSGGVFINDR
jgi:cobalt-zinc-cadmium efflux system membrane fusion protein